MTVPFLYIFWYVLQDHPSGPDENHGKCKESQKGWQKRGKNVATCFKESALSTRLGSLLVDHKMHNCRVGRECVLGSAAQLGMHP